MRSFPVDAEYRIISGTTDDDTLTGHNGTDEISGGAGNDIIAGLIGFDRLDGGDGVADVLDYSDSTHSVEVALLGSSWANATVCGSTEAIVRNFENVAGGLAADTLTGDNQHNAIDGRGGNDTMAGLSGNDVYIVDSAYDLVAESVSQGTDTIYAKVSYRLTNKSSVEVLRTYSSLTTTAINLVGNAFAQTIIGNTGKNFIVGGGGADTLRGLAGNDAYLVDDAGDGVIERAGQGTDNVNTTVSYALGAGISVETLRTADPAATAAIDLTGNELANIVTGNAGANVINGSAGNDRLTGRAGGDRFVFDTALDAAANVDTITDFDVTQDKIGLDNSVFASLVKPGSLSTNAFRIGTASEDANDYIIYNDVTGALSYDADGSRAGDAIQFARLSAGLALTASDFIVI